MPFVGDCCSTGCCANAAPASASEQPISKLVSFFIISCLVVECPRSIQALSVISLSRALANLFGVTRHRSRTETSCNRWHLVPSRVRIRKYPRARVNQEPRKPGKESKKLLVFFLGKTCSRIAALPSTRAIGTRSLPTSLAATHRGFAFYVASPKSSIPSIATCSMSVIQFPRFLGS